MIFGIACIIFGNSCGILRADIVKDLY